MRAIKPLMGVLDEGANECTDTQKTLDTEEKIISTLSAYLYSPVDDDSRSGKRGESKQKISERVSLHGH